MKARQVFPTLFRCASPPERIPMLHLVTSCRTHRQAFLPLLILLMLLVACTTTEERDASAPSPSAAVGSLTVEEDDYLSAAVPTSTRSDDPLTVSVDGASFAIEHGPFTMSFGEGAVSDAVLVRGHGGLDSSGLRRSCPLSGGRAARPAGAG